MPYIAKETEAEEAALLEREEEFEEKRVPQHEATTRRAVAFAVASAVGAAAVFACAGYAAQRSPLVKAGMDFEGLQQQFGPTGQCPQMEVNVEYQDTTSGFGMNFDHIPNPDLCCALCQANPQC